MKSSINLLAIFSLVFLCSFAANAQRKDYKTEIYYGINAGMTAAKVNFDPSVAQNYITGYQGGFVFRYISSKSLGVQAELNYTQRGWSESDGLYARQLNYMELPFLTHFNFGNNFRFFFNIGPKIGYLLSENVIINQTINSTSTQHITAVQNKFDYGFCSGLGFLLNIKGQVFQLEGRGNYSMNDIFSNAKKDYFDTSNNMYATVSFSWLMQQK